MVALPASSPTEAPPRGTYLRVLWRDDTGQDKLSVGWHDHTLCTRHTMALRDEQGALGVIIFYSQITAITVPVPPGQPQETDGCERSITWTRRH